MSSEKDGALTLVSGLEQTQDFLQLKCHSTPEHYRAHNRLAGPCLHPNASVGGVTRAHAGPVVRERPWEPRKKTTKKWGEANKGRKKIHKRAPLSRLQKGVKVGKVFLSLCFVVSSSAVALSPRFRLSIENEHFTHCASDLATN